MTNTNFSDIKSAMSKIFYSKNDSAESSAGVVDQNVHKELAKTLSLFQELKKYTTDISRKSGLIESSDVKYLRQTISDLRKLLEQETIKKSLIEYLANAVVALKKEEKYTTTISSGDAALFENQKAIESTIKIEYTQIEKLYRKLGTLYDVLDNDVIILNQKIDSSSDLTNIIDKWNNEYKKLEKFFQDIEDCLQQLLESLASNHTEFKRMYADISDKKIKYGFSKKQDDFIKRIYQYIVDGKMNNLPQFNEKDAYKIVQELFFNRLGYDAEKKFYQRENNGIKCEIIQGYIPDIEDHSVTANNYIHGANLDKYLFTEERVPLYIYEEIVSNNAVIEIHACDESICISNMIERGFKKFYTLNLWFKQDRKYIIGFKEDGEILLGITNITGYDLLIHTELMLKSANIPNSSVRTYIYHKDNLQYYADNIPSGFDVLGLGMFRYSEVLIDRMYKTFLLEKIQQFIFGQNEVLIKDVNDLCEQGYLFQLKDKITALIHIYKCPACKAALDKAHCDKCDVETKEFSTPLASLFSGPNGARNTYLICSNPKKMFKYNSYNIYFVSTFLPMWNKIVEIYRQIDIFLPTSTVGGDVKTNVKKSFHYADAISSRIGHIDCREVHIGNVNALLMGYPYGDLSKYIAKAAIRKKVRHIFFSGTAGGLDLEMYHGRKLKQSDLIAPDNFFIRYANNVKAVFNDAANCELFEKDVSFSLSHVPDIDIIEQWYKENYLSGVFITNHNIVSSVLLEDRELDNAFKKQYFETMDIENFHVAAAIIESGKNVKFTSILNCSDVLFTDKDITSGYEVAVTMGIKNRIMDYFLETFNIQYEQSIHNSILEIVKAEFKREKIIKKT